MLFRKSNQQSGVNVKGKKLNYLLLTDTTTSKLLLIEVIMIIRVAIPKQRAGIRTAAKGRGGETGYSEKDHVIKQGKCVGKTQLSKTMDVVKLNTYHPKTACSDKLETVQEGLKLV